MPGSAEAVMIEREQIRKLDDSTFKQLVYVVSQENARRQSIRKLTEQEAEALSQRAV